MNQLRKIFLAAGLLGAALATTGGVLIAAPGDAAKADPKGGDKPGDKPGGKDAPKLPSLQEMRVAVNTSLTAAAEDEKSVHRLRIAAKKDKDVIKLNCVNDKLVQINGLLNLLDDTVEAFKAASIENDTDAARTPHGEIADKSTQIRRLKEEALACFGDELGHIGDGEVEVDGPDMPDDPTQGFPGNDLEPPVYVTPWS
jgi:hypothetical protein